ncbi:MAG: 23S rRNA (guanosine(2251)-2'-O)-methyltransferase RlmB [Pseudomonadota bacterium]
MSHELEWVYGIHACHALLNRHPERIVSAHALKGRDDPKFTELLNALSQLRIDCQVESRERLDELIQTQQHQGIALQCKPSQVFDKSYLNSLLKRADSDLLLLILDGVTDPHNLGACIRSAEAAGADAVIIPKHKAASLSPVTRKVACGAAEIIPIVSVKNLAQCLSDLKDQGVWLYGAAGEASSSIYQTDLTGHVGLILGSEGDGLRQLTRSRCDVLINIPMAGHTSSLNVSVAAGVCLFEALRQRTAKR